MIKVNFLIGFQATAMTKETASHVTHSNGRKILAVSTQLVQLRKESLKKNSGLNLIRTHDLCDAGAVLYQLSYQAKRELVILWVLNIPVKDEEIIFFLRTRVLFCLFRSIPLLFTCCEYLWLREVALLLLKSPIVNFTLCTFPRYLFSFSRALLCKSQTKWEEKIFDANVPTSWLSR